MMERRQRPWCFAAVLAVICLLSWPALFQRSAARAGSGGDPEVQAGAAIRSWTIERKNESVKVSQISAPILLKSPLGFDGLGFTAYIAGASSEVDGSDLSKLGAATDTELKLDYLMPNERVFLSVGTSLPTGDTELDDDGVLVSRAVSNQILGFRTNRYGEGLDFFGDLAVAWPISQTWSVGFGSGYRHKGSYDFAPETASALIDFDPGEEVFGSGGMSYIERGASATISLNMDVTFRTYTEDAIAADPVFQEGDELELRVSGTRTGERWSAGGAIRSVTKSDHEFLGSPDLLTFGSPVEDVLLGNVSAGLLQLSFSLGYRVTPTLTLTAFGHSTRYEEVVVADPSGGEDLITRGNAAAYEPGLSLGWSPGRSVRFHVNVSGLGGYAEDGDLNISGLDVSTAVAIGL